MAKVSILIPAYNAADTLHATLESVSDQGCRDWELIILDDGSADETAKLARTWVERDPRIRLERGPNRGAASARNHAAQYAGAPWLLFLDSDDLIAPEHLETMLTAAASVPTADLIYAGGARFSVDGRVGAPEFPPRDSIFKHSASFCPFFMHACFVRRATFEEHRGFDSSLVIGEDWDLWQRMARGGAHFVPVDRCLAFYRLRPGSLSHNPSLLFESARRIIRRAHSSDARVARPIADFRNGVDQSGEALAVLENALWCVALQIGSGQDPLEFLNGIRSALPAVVAVDVNSAVSRIQGGVPVGACLTQNDWPLLWLSMREPIREALDWIEKTCMRPGYSSSCMLELESRVGQLARSDGTALKRIEDFVPAAASGEKPRIEPRPRSGAAPPTDRAALANAFVRNIRNPNVDRVMIVAAHQDDEIIGAGGQLRFWPGLSVVYVTNGAPQDERWARQAGFSDARAYSDARRQEAENALALVGLSVDKITPLGVNDLFATQSLTQIAHGLQNFFEKERPEVVVTHSYEGGHPDHDATACAVHAACQLAMKSNSFVPAVAEMSSYFGRDGIRVSSTFLRDDIPSVSLRLDKEDLAIKRRMIEQHVSQRDLLRSFPLAIECFRVAPKYDFYRAPHEGRLFYEYHDLGMDGAYWRDLATKALRELDLV